FCSTRVDARDHRAQVRSSRQSHLVCAVIGERFRRFQTAGSELPANHPSPEGGGSGELVMLKSDISPHSDDQLTREATPEAASGLLDFHAFQLVIRRRARLIVAIVAVSLLATVAALMLIPPRYGATAV